MWKSPPGSSGLRRTRRVSRTADGASEPRLGGASSPAGGAARQRLCTRRRRAGEPARRHRLPALLSRSCCKPLSPRGHQLLQRCHPGEEARGLGCTLRPPGGGGVTASRAGGPHSCSDGESRGYSHPGKSRSKRVLSHSVSTGLVSLDLSRPEHKSRKAALSSLPGGKARPSGGGKSLRVLARPQEVRCSWERVGHSRESRTAWTAAAPLGAAFRVREREGGGCRAGSRVPLRQQRPPILPASQRDCGTHGSTWPPGFETPVPEETSLLQQSPSYSQGDTLEGLTRLSFSHF